MTAARVEHAPPPAATAKWHSVTTPFYQELCHAILSDESQRVIQALGKSAVSGRGVSRETIPVELHSPAGHMLHSRNATLGHLLALFSSAETLQSLLQARLISASQFSHRTDWEVSMKHFSKQEDRVVKTWKSVPCVHMCAIRDNEEALIWLTRNRFLRKLQEVDGNGENILHICVEEEAYHMCRSIVRNESLCRKDALNDILTRKDAKNNRTPLTKAATCADPAMLITLLQAAPDEYLMGRGDLTGVGVSIYSFLFENLEDPRLIVEVVKDLLRRNISPEKTMRSTQAERNILSKAIECDFLSQDDLQTVLNIFCKYGAKVTPSAMVSVLNSKMTNDEILSTARTLLKYGEPAEILGAKTKSSNNLKEETSQKNALLQIVKNPHISKELMNQLLTLFEEFVDVKTIMPRRKEV